MLMFLALWITRGSERVHALEECDYDQECEPSQGENCEFCSDCTCSCGDNYCSEYEPHDETCVTCPEDCESLCICGDGWCDWPAEGGVGPTWPTCQMSGNPECTTCTVDCWECQWAWSCDTGVCRDGICIECESIYDCSEFAASCNFGLAECVAGTCECFI
jgi:hypothetical protein